MGVARPAGGAVCQGNRATADTTVVEWGVVSSFCRMVNCIVGGRRSGEA